jgi:uncharacterized Fe-S cluster protein YjdI
LMIVFPTAIQTVADNRVFELGHSPICDPSASNLAKIHSFIETSHAS